MTGIKKINLISAVLVSLSLCGGCTLEKAGNSSQDQTVQEDNETEQVKAEVISDKKFIEYTKDGYPTTFTVTLVEPYRRWEFDMENSNMTGHWTGIFTAKGDETEIDFTEQVKAKKWLLKPFVKSYLRKQQTQFVADIMKNFS